MNQSTPNGMEQRNYAANDTIFTAGQPGGPAFIVKSGKVEVSRMVNSQKVVLETLGPDCIFGATSFIDAQPRTTTAMALEPAICLMIPERHLQEHYEKSSNFIKMLLRMMVGTIRETSGRM
ncbi:MAG: cyclic nucleotide-binding domain-containing protein, partial [Alphaproteobacteria bacterium]|nr:cyclic nucleotide-binding domain-containing protein [Alphaproteobacteria bacterium]